jgi:type II secretory pathway pseudopilin PulG
MADAIPAWAKARNAEYRAPLPPTTNGPIVTLPELPYEKTVYEGPVYPGTLTYFGTVPTIKGVRPRCRAGDRHKVAGDTGSLHSSYTTLFNDLVSRSGEPQERQMLMRSLETNAGHRRHRESGFSLLEMMTVVALVIIMASISFVSLVPAMKQYRVSNAYNITLSAMRQARDNAISQRTSYSVTFLKTASLSTITVAPTLSTFQGAQNTTTYQLPTDVSFDAESSLASTPAPDGYGTGLAAIDFGYTANGATGGATTIYFCPDGSAQDAEGGAGNCAGSWNGGVVYIARPGDLMSSRAVTLWGGTGRIRGWRLYSKTGGGYQWLRQ